MTERGRIEAGEMVELDDVNYRTRTVGRLVDGSAIVGVYGTYTIITSPGVRFRSEGVLTRYPPRQLPLEATVLEGPLPHRSGPGSRVARWCNRLRRRSGVRSDLRQRGDHVPE